MRAGGEAPRGRGKVSPGELGLFNRGGRAWTQRRRNAPTRRAEGNGGEIPAADGLPRRAGAERRSGRRGGGATGREDGRRGARRGEGRAVRARSGAGSTGGGARVERQGGAATTGRAMVGGGRGRKQKRSRLPVGRGGRGRRDRRVKCGRELSEACVARAIVASSLAGWLCWAGGDGWGRAGLLVAGGREGRSSAGVREDDWLAGRGRIRSE